MKKIKLKSLFTVIVILAISGISLTSASRFIGGQLVGEETPISDTIITNDSELASLLPRSLYIIDNPNRVVYPDILKEHRSESKQYIASYVKSNRKYIALMFRRGAKYMPVAKHIFDKYDVPHEFQVLPALESNFVGHAVSPAGAVGYWQFMPQLAREYGLKIGGANDERKNFNKSTNAAARFIRDQLNIYHDPLLVVAAYNCGPGRVNYAIKNSGSDSFWDLKEYLPAETRKFVLRFLALNVVAENYDMFLANEMDLNEPATIQLANYDSIKNEDVPLPLPRM